MFFGAAEALLRVAGWPGLDDTGVFEHNDVYWIQDPNLDNLAFSHRETGGSFQVSTDANGLRAPNHPEAKDPGVFRILLMGCSTTFGWGVEDAETYPARLQALAREAGYEKVEVINGGQPGYTSFQGLWFWEEVASKYEADLVVLGFVVQDARKAAYSDLSQAILTGNGSFLKSNVLYKWRLYLLLKTFQGDLVVRTKERPDGGDGGVYRVSESSYLQNLRDLRGQIEATGAKVMHFGFPLERIGYTEQHRRLLRLESESAEIPFYDPSEEIELASRSTQLYFEQDRGHPNAEGCEVIAKGMLGFLEERQLLFR
ncbi:MAG: SGNH/GDSL hydrolase family protein [Myxococcota bacterium]|nr:SGNH/GDSL hydrolase family protein [Myxococcota bacterium]